MKQKIDLFEYAEHIFKHMKKGILLTTKRNDKVNTMTIGWGTLGIEWGKPIFVAYVREGRYTRALLDDTGEFTVNIPYGDFNPQVLGICGTKSGRDTDKIEECALDLVESECIAVPGIRQFPLTLECKVLSRQVQNIGMLPQSILDRYYPLGVDGSHVGSNEDYHIAYYAEIVNAYLIT